MKTTCLLSVALAALATATINTICAATLCVSPDSPGPAPPYASWTTAAANIQDAIDTAGGGR